MFFSPAKLAQALFLKIILTYPCQGGLFTFKNNIFLLIIAVRNVERLPSDSTGIVHLPAFHGSGAGRVACAEPGRGKASFPAFPQLICLKYISLFSNGQDLSHIAFYVNPMFIQETIIFVHFTKMILLFPKMMIFFSI